MNSNFDALRMAMQVLCPENALLLDDSGEPSVMVYIPAFKLCDVLSTSDESVHPAFIVKGSDIEGFYVGKYQTRGYEGRAYSLPAEDPTTGLGHDEHGVLAAAKGAGWHELTNAEWAAVALWCHKHGCEPKGNNANGRDKRESDYVAVPSYQSTAGVICRTATGTGPAAWSHDGQMGGIFDLNGNVREWVTGVRLVYGELQIVANNDAAADGADVRDGSGAWRAIRASDGALIVPDGGGTTEGSVKLDCVNAAGVWSANMTDRKDAGRSCLFKNVKADSTVGAAAKRLLQALALLPDTALTGTGIDASYGGDYLYYNNGAAERCAGRGGSWIDGDGAGVFCLDFGYARTSKDSHSGGRCAYVKG